MSEQAVETVTEDRTGPLRAPASQNELQSRTSGARSLNTAFGSFVEVFKLFRRNHLHITGLVGPQEVEIECLASLRPSRKLIISASSLLPLFITIGSDFSTIVSIDRVSGQHADQSKWLTDAEMCICSGGRRTGIGSSPYPHFKYFTGGKNDQVVLPWTAC